MAQKTHFGYQQHRALNLNPGAGARNLLHNCIKARCGDTLLIVGEEYGNNYYDDEVALVIAREAQAMGITAEILRAPLATGPEAVPQIVLTMMQDFHHTVFLSRLGDQIRFTDLHIPCTKTMCYVLDVNYLGSEFARTPWGLYKRIHDRLLQVMLAAKRYRITCPLGTDLVGEIPQHYEASCDHDALTDFTVNVFPVMIYPPLNCLNVCGQLVLERFLMSTSIYRFENSVMTLAQPLIAHLDNSRIVRFQGDAQLMKQVEQHYQRIGALSTGDAFAIHSWHTGIYPKTFYVADPYANLQRWGDLAFASPRYTHFHTCGSAPGHIASATFDATIAFDDELFWDQGRFVFLDRPEIQALLDDYPDAVNAYEMRWDIGL